jgi:hypothetical protein
MRCFTNKLILMRVRRFFTQFSGTLLHLTMLVLFLGFSNKGVLAQAVVTDVTFTQFDRYGTDGKLIFQHSSLGQFSFSATPDQKSMHYLNIFAKTTTGKDAWIVQNLPVAPDTDAEPIACQAVDVDFKLLEVKPGIQVQKVEFSVNISPILLTVKNPVPVFLRVGEDPSIGIIKANQFSSANAAFGAPVIINYAAAPVIRGKLRHELSGDYSDAKDVALYTNAAPIAALVAKDRDIPGDLDEDPDGCVPGAFARSIAWLSTQPNFRTSTPLKPKDIYDTLKKRMDTCTMPSSNPCKIKVKADYLKELTGGRGTTRRIMPVTSPADTIKKYPDCDIEIDIQQLPGESLGHFIVVVGIECGTDGCCTVKYRDDSDQNNPGGDGCVKTAKICGDSITTDKKRKIRSLVIECVPAASREAEKPTVKENIKLLPNIPNPFDNMTLLRIEAKETVAGNSASLTITNDRGMEIRKIKLSLHKGINEVRYQPERNVKGILYCTLEVDGKVVGSQKMFAK